MTKRSLRFFVLLGALASTAFAQDAKTVIDSATKAMGSLKTVEYSGSGFDFAIGQNANPNIPWPKFIDKTYKRTMLGGQVANGPITYAVNGKQFVSVAAGNGLFTFALR